MALGRGLGACGSGHPVSAVVIPFCVCVERSCAASNLVQALECESCCVRRTPRGVWGRLGFDNGTSTDGGVDAVFMPTYMLTRDLHTAVMWLNAYVECAQSHDGGCVVTLAKAISPDMCIASHRIKQPSLGLFGGVLCHFVASHECMRIV